MPELHTQPGDEWHRLTVDETLLRLESDLDEGLTAAEAQARMARYGPNRITTHKGIGPIRRALAQISQPLVVILVIAGAITAALQQWVDRGHLRSGGDQRHRRIYTRGEGG